MPDTITPKTNAVALKPDYFKRTYPVIDSAEQVSPTHTLSVPFEHRYLNLPLSFRHQKDISIAQSIDQDGQAKYHMLLSVNNRDDQKGWSMRSLSTRSLKEDWIDHGEVIIQGIEGDEVCAAGLLKSSRGTFEIFVQTRCFDEGGKIIHAVSDDNLTYVNPSVVLDSIPNSHRANVYDAEPVIVEGANGQIKRHFTVTCVGYYEKGCAKNGGIYLAYETKKNTWELDHIPLFTEYSIPAHIPTLNAGEWVPEGGKLLQTARNKFLFYGTCFTDGIAGTRQRGFFAISNDLSGPFTFLGTIDPFAGHGETGHGTIMLNNDPSGARTIELFNQTRSYDLHTNSNSPWTSEHRSYRLDDFLTLQQYRNSKYPLSCV